MTAHHVQVDERYARKNVGNVISSIPSMLPEDQGIVHLYDATLAGYEDMLVRGVRSSWLCHLLADHPLADHIPRQPRSKVLTPCGSQSCRGISNSSPASHLQLQGNLSCEHSSLQRVSCHCQCSQQLGTAYHSSCRRYPNHLE